MLSSSLNSSFHTSWSSSFVTWEGSALLREYGKVMRVKVGRQHMLRSTGSWLRHHEETWECCNVSCMKVKWLHLRERFFSSNSTHTCVMQHALFYKSIKSADIIEQAMHIICCVLTPPGWNLQCGSDQGGSVTRLWSTSPPGKQKMLTAVSPIRQDIATVTERLSQSHEFRLVSRSNVRPAGGNSSSQQEMPQNILGLSSVTDWVQFIWSLEPCVLFDFCTSCYVSTLIVLPALHFFHLCL